MLRVFSSLRFRLILIVTLAILPAMALVLYSGSEQRASAAAYARQNTRRLVELGSLQQARQIEEAHRLLITLSGRFSARLQDAEQCSAHMTELVKLHPHYLNLGFIGPDGSVLCSAYPSGTGMDLSDRDYFQRALKGSGLAIGSYKAERLSGKTSLNFGYPVKDAEGHVRAVAFAAMDMAWLNAMAGRAELPKGATLTVVDRQGTILARYPHPDLWVGKVVANSNVLSALLDSQKDGVTEGTGVDGVNRLYAYTPLDDPPHTTYLYTGIPIATIYEEANRALLRNLLGLGAVSILAVGAAHLFGHLFVMRRVDSLVMTARQLEAGDLTARTTSDIGARELALLAKTLDELAESLERKGAERNQMEEALRRSEAKYRTLVEQVPTVTYVASPDSRRTLLYISPQIDTLLGYDQADFELDPDLLSKRLHPDDRERVIKEVASCQKEMDLFVCEYRMLTFNDLEKWVRDEAVTVFGDTGEPLFTQGVLIDVTEQKRTEEELRKAHDELELRVEERTRELAKANQELRQSAEKLKLFAYSVVHDLKSPAIGAYGLTRLLQRQYEHSLDARANHYCDQIVRASEHIAELVEKINVFIATKESPLKIEPVHVGEILQALKEEFSSKLSLRRVKWVEPETCVEINADRLSLLRAFRNYVDNALKYGGERLSQISIGYEERDDCHVFSVNDDGQGMSEADSERIFQIFERDDTSGEIEGAGLGLAIVKEIADRHGGKVWVESSPQTGARFFLSISRTLQPRSEDHCSLQAESTLAAASDRSGKASSSLSENTPTPEGDGS
ncbi:MAG: ATP-binding protein [Syntrophobacteraceae bacterium]